jgi:alpha-galactosidase
MAYKIVLFGAGSSMFTPQLVSLMIQSKALQGSTIALMDINPKRLELMNILSRQLVEKSGADLKIECTTERREALTNASFVVTSIAVGGFPAWEKDIEIPAKYGIFVPYGDSVGPGGMSRAFRHVLPMVQMCKDLEEVSPNAWVFNYTNPASALCYAMRQETSIKVVSLCTNTVPLRFEKFGATLAGVKPGEVVLPPTVGGINHCSAITEFHLKDGSDAFPLIRKKARHPVVRWALENFDVLPIVWPHWIEFFPMLSKPQGQYAGRAQGMALSFGMQVKDMEYETKRITQWENLVAQWARGEGEPDVSAIPETEPVQLVDVLEALIEDKKEVHVLNLPNHGAIENLPEDAVVEVGALISGQSIQALQAGRLPEGYAAWMRLHIDVQKLTVQAALTGDRKVALQALQLDPFVSANLTLQQTSQLLDELLTAQAAHLPQFN